MAEHTHRGDRINFDFRHLVADSRREWQNPEEILKEAGIDRGMKVADLGCGPGFFTMPMARKVGPDGIVYAIDRNDEAVGYLKKAVEAERGISKTVRIINSDISDTGIPSGSVDVSFFANVLHDIKNMGKFLAEVKRINKKDALVVDVDWEKPGKTDVRGPPEEIRISEAEAERILEKEGFILLKKINAGPHHYGLVYRNI